MHQTLKKRCKFTLRLLDLSNTSFEQNIRLKSLSCLLVIPAIFLSVVSLPTWLTLGYYWRKSLTHLMLISAFELTTFGPKVIRRCWGSTPNWVSSGLWSQWHNPLSHSPQIVKNILPRLASRFSKMWKCPNTQNSYSLTLWWPLSLHNTSLDAKFIFQNFSFSWSIKSVN